MHRTAAMETIEKYAFDIAKSKELITKLQSAAPHLSQRITSILEQEQGIEL